MRGKSERGVSPRQGSALGHRHETSFSSPPHTAGTPNFPSWKAATFDSGATAHDPSLCVYIVEGCTDSLAYNYLDVANTEASPSVCRFPRLVLANPAAASSTTARPEPALPRAHPPSSHCLSSQGCTLADGTLNFDSLAIILDGCHHVKLGCSDSGKQSYCPQARSPA